MEITGIFRGWDFVYYIIEDLLPLIRYNGAYPPKEDKQSGKTLLQIIQVLLLLLDAFPVVVNVLVDIRISYYDD